MDETTQTKLDEYLELLAAAKERVADESVAMNLVQEIARDRRSDRIRTERQTTPQPSRGAMNSESASKKQIDWLLDLGVRIPQYCTRAQAHDLLTEALEKQAGR